MDSPKQLVDGAKASRQDGCPIGREKLTYEDIFYRELKPTSKTYQKFAGGTRGNAFVQFMHSLLSGKNGAKTDSKKTCYRGFPQVNGNWCQSDLKKAALRISLQRSSGMVSRTQTGFSNQPQAQGAKINTVQYIGIAADEPKRIERHEVKPGIVMPLVEAGWTEQMCRDWCEQNNLLAPTYTTSMRGGCWFCHNQGVDQLRLLRHNHPELWKILLKWDDDSPVTFKADGHTVHDFDRRFALEDAGLVGTENFRWIDTIRHQTTIDEILNGM